MASAHASPDSTLHDVQRWLESVGDVEAAARDWQHQILAREQAEPAMAHAPSFMQDSEPSAPPDADDAWVDDFVRGVGRSPINALWRECSFFTP